MPLDNYEHTKIIYIYMEMKMNLFLFPNLKNCKFSRTIFFYSFFYCQTKSIKMFVKKHIYTSKYFLFTYGFLKITILLFSLFHPIEQFSE